MSTADLYELLQVHPRADPDVIRAAFRVLAHKHHPDNGGDGRMMAALNIAWSVLSDPGRRTSYDKRRASRGHGFSATPTGSTATPTSSSARPPERPLTQTVPSPPGRPSGTVLDFGRYTGWSLGRLADHDANYLEWLQRTPIGRPLHAEIQSLLAGGRISVATASAELKTRPRRRGRR